MEGEESPLERVRRRLYEQAARPEASAPAAAARVTGETQGWKPEAPKARGLSATAWFFVIAVGFFLVAGIAAALILFLGARTVGNDRMSVGFEGPVSVDGGEEVPFDVIIENGNPVTATEVMLTIDFPPEAFDPVTLEPLTHYSVSVPDLEPGAVARESVRVVFFGAEGQKVPLPVSLEYRTPNSSAVFVKEAEREVAIATAPLSIRVTAAPQIASGQRYAFTASVRSNADETLRNAALKIDYPFGFTALDSEPAPIGQNVFRLGDIAPGEEKEVTVRGILVGEDGDERVFRFTGGLLEDEEGTTIRMPAFTLATSDVTIAKSFLAVNLALNQETGDIVAAPGESVQGTLSFANALTSAITDGEIRIALSGDALDPDSVDVVNGFYRSSDRTIVFDKSTEPGLRNLAPGENGIGAFRFSLRSEDELASRKNATVVLTISVAGRRVDEGGASESLSSTLTRTVRLGTALSLASGAVRSVGPFENSGPYPPQADRETTYTVQWAVENSLNAVANATVSATLPTYVRYTGYADPSSGISYDEEARVVTWTLGELGASMTREGAFQIAVTPSVSQRGTAPVILVDQKISGYDRTTKRQVSGTAPDLTTDLADDPSFEPGDGDVR